MRRGREKWQCDALTMVSAAATRGGNASTPAEENGAEKDAESARRRAREIVDKYDALQRELGDAGADIVSVDDDEANSLIVVDDVDAGSGMSDADLAAEVRRNLGGCSIWLVGMMGSGKSSVGRELARVLAYDFEDSDAVVERTKRRSVAEVIRAEGIEGFRAVEAETIAGLAGRTQLVLATGGGAVLRNQNWSKIHAGIVVYLRGDVGALARRVEAEGTAKRPLADGKEDVRTRLETLLRDRRTKYEEADAAVDVTNGVSMVARDGRLATRFAIGKDEWEFRFGESADDKPMATIVRDVLVNANKLMIVKQKQDELSREKRPEIAARLQEQLNKQRTEAKKVEEGGTLPCITQRVSGGGDAHDDDAPSPSAAAGSTSDNASNSGIHTWKWTQNSIEVYVYLPVEDSVRLRDIEVKIEPRRIAVDVCGSPMIAGELEAEVAPDECMWEINDDDGDRKLYIVLWKTLRARWLDIFSSSPSSDISPDNGAQ